MKSKPILIDGTEYRSMRHAARTMGVSLAAIQHAIRDGRNLSEILPGNPVKRGARPAEKPITIRGVEYPSQTIAAEVLGVAPNTISHAKLRGSLDTVGLGMKGRPPSDL